MEEKKSLVSNFFDIKSKLEKENMAETEQCFNAKNDVRD